MSHLFRRKTSYLLSNYVTVWAVAMIVAQSVGCCLLNPTCFYLGSQDGLRRERQQADEVAHRAVGLFSEAFPKLEGVVSSEQSERWKTQIAFRPDFNLQAVVVCS